MKKTTYIIFGLIGASFLISAVGAIAFTLAVRTEQNPWDNIENVIEENIQIIEDGDTTFYRIPIEVDDDN
ncbi:MAG: hypothetical protein LUD17_13470 [Bacteroidales bacterium]|nr:hypothetical protein [Bacteroidales bacterium]